MSLDLPATLPPRDLADFDEDRCYDLAEQLARNLNALSVARLRENVPVPAKDVGGIGAKGGLTADFNLPATLMRTLTALQNDDMGLAERIGILQQQPADKLQALGACGLLDAGDVFATAVFSGEMHDIESAWQVMNLARHPGRQRILDTALAIAASYGELDDGSESQADAAIVEYLFKLGANPNADHGETWQRALEERDGDVCAVFAAAGADAVPLLKALQGEREYDYFYRQVREKTAGKLLFGRINDVTLAEYCPLDDIKTAPVTYYRFDTGRVIEQLVVRGQSSDPTSYRFEDVPVAALQERHDRLCALGGNPPPLEKAMLPGAMTGPLRLKK